MIREKFGLNEEDGKLMAKVARRSHQINAVYTWEKFQAMGYLWTMIPVINKLYGTFAKPLYFPAISNLLHALHTGGSVSDYIDFAVSKAH